MSEQVFKVSTHDLKCPRCW